jgi:hypothetical protein
LQKNAFQQECIEKIEPKVISYIHYASRGFPRFHFFSRNAINMARPLSHQKNPILKKPDITSDGWHFGK